MDLSDPELIAVGASSCAQGGAPSSSGCAGGSAPAVCSYGASPNLPPPPRVCSYGAAPTPGWSLIHSWTRSQL